MKIKLWILVSIFGVTSVFGQKSGNIEFGMGIGLNNSSGSDDNSGDRFGLNLAIFADYHLNETWGVRVKVIYDQKGWDDTHVFGSGLPHDFGSIGDFELTYVTVPVMAAYHFLPKKSAYINLGPYLGMLTDAKYYNTEAEGIKSFDYGLSFAVGIKKKISKGRHALYFELESQLGLVNAYDDSNDPNNLVNGNADNKNIRTSLNAGFIF